MAAKGTVTVLVSAVVCAAVVFGAVKWEDSVALPTPAGQVVDGVHQFTINEFNYRFVPTHMVWHVGEKVSLTIENRSQSQPPIAHQFSLGRNLETRNNGFPGQPLAVGWKNDFFDGVPLTIAGQTAPIPSFSVSLEGGQKFHFTFVVPNKPGKWDYGCFLQTGQHFMNGMRGHVTILPAQGA